MSCFHHISFIFFPFNCSPSKPGPSFQRPVLSAPVPVNVYIQGSPILTLNDQYFTIPQVCCFLIQFFKIIFCIVCIAKAVTTNAVYISVPQKALGQCVNSAPVAFLKNIKVNCVTLLRSCPTGSPLQTLPTDLSIKLKNGQGGMFDLLNIL